VASRKYGHWKDSNNCYVQLIPYWKRFSENYSKSSITGYYLELVKFALWSWRHFRKGILEVEPEETLRYFSTKINKRDVLKSSKIRVYSFISSYYNHVEDYKKVFEKKEFTNPIPRTLIKFEGKTSILDDLEQDFHLLLMEDVKRLVRYFYFLKDKMYYIILCLIVYGGPRISEVTKIERDNLYMAPRWYLTVVKSSKSNKRVGIYFFPEFFTKELQEYFNDIKIKYPESKFLFPSSSSKSGHISKRTIEKHLKMASKALGITALSYPHAFRDFLNSRREERGATQVQRKFLLNQKNPDVNPNSYLKKYKNRMLLRNYYDRFNPFKESLKPKMRLF